MKKFEYKTGNFPGNFHCMRDFLNGEGEEGWELVMAQFNGGFHTSYILKREKEEDQTTGKDVPDFHPVRP